ncbi:MAG: hypothetical protein ACK4SY_05990 [Pyrobaculum sp.]
MIQKKKVAELEIDPRVLEVLRRVLGPEEEVYVMQIGNRTRIIL